MDDKDRKTRSRLEALGADRLAEALYILARRNETVSAYVNMLLSPESESRERIHNNLENLLCEDYFYNCYESSDLAEQLAEIVDDILLNIMDPADGLALMKYFFETDALMLEKCDDSNDYVADVYEFQATDIFGSFAAAHKDKTLVADQALTLYLQSEYGVRNNLIKHAENYLPEPQLRQMVAALEAEVEASDETNFSRQRALEGIEMLAKQLKDPVLFEKTRLRITPDYTLKDCIDIARQYHECSQNTNALDWLQKSSVEPGWQEEKKDELLYCIYLQEKNSAKAEEVAWRMFRRSRTKERFERLITTIGEEHGEKILHDQATSLLNSNAFMLDDAVFLVDMGKIDEAATYLVRWAEHLNGNCYYVYKSLADEMEINGEHLAATVIYRALLSEILNQGKNQAYQQGANYLHKLDVLAEKIEYWQTVPPHAVFTKELTTRHKRKWRFWKTYGKHP